MSQQSANATPESGEGRGDVLDTLIVLAKHKKLIIGFPFAFSVLVAGIVLLVPNVYTATTKILPPQQGQSGATAILAQFAGLAGLVGGGSSLKNPNDVYVSMLKSRTVEDNLVQRFDLMQLYDQKYPSRARKMLEDVTKITSGIKDGIITIDVDDKDPKRAADMANAYVEELLKLTQVLAVTDASQRRLFYERQFLQAKDNLAKAEAAARSGLGSGGLVKVDDQGRTMVEASARLRGQITAKEVQIGAMRAFAAEGNPDLQLAQQEVESMKIQLAKLEGTNGAKPIANGMGGQGMDSLRLLRDVKYNEVLFELLGKQYELAKLDEAKDSSVVQVMDKAVVPDYKSKPVRWLITVISGVVALLAVVLWVLVREGMSEADPQQKARLDTLKGYLSWRRNA
jgi:tyrosine-protein kinase Etk/Wzc